MKTKRLPIDISKIEKYYRVEEDGAIYSLTKKRYLKPTHNTAGYWMVYLHLYIPHWFSVHRLVYFKYVGICPDHLEVAHKDGVKNNCHWGNLEAIGHGRNCRDSYREHHRKPSYGNKGHLASWETKQLMAEIKKKPVVDSWGEWYESIEKAAKANGISRKSVERSIHHGIRLKRLGKNFEFAEKKL